MFSIGQQTSSSHVVDARRTPSNVELCMHSLEKSHFYFRPPPQSSAVVDLKVANKNTARFGYFFVMQILRYSSDGYCLIHHKVCKALERQIAFVNILFLEYVLYPLGQPQRLLALVA